MLTKPRALWATLVMAASATATHAFANGPEHPTIAPPWLPVPTEAAATPSDSSESQLQAQAAAIDCSRFTAPVYQRNNPTTNVNLLTPWKGEADKAAAESGFSEDWGAPYRVGLGQTDGAVAIHRLFSRGVNDFVWATASTVAGWVQRGYADQSASFYGASQPGPGCAAVYHFEKGTKNRFAPESKRAALVQAGWQERGIAFYTAPGDPIGGSEPFTFAVIPDSQAWTDGKDNRFSELTSWLVAQRDSRNIKFVTSTGDVSNWGWVDPPQLEVVSKAMKNLEDGKIPYLTALGNHDTRAVGWDGKGGYGGDAYQKNPECAQKYGDQCKSWLLVRETGEYNAVFPRSRFVGLSGTFEDGKIENAYSLFSAGGKDWLVLSLEFAPRENVITWAKEVVSENLSRNVIVITHFYLAGDGTITPSNGGYGAQSGQYVFDNLIKAYPNVKLVFSGHNGSAAYREDTGVNGNKIASMVLNNLGDAYTPVRLVEIDPDTGVVKTRIFSPRNNKWFSEHDKTTTLSFE